MHEMHFSQIQQAFEGPTSGALPIQKWAGGFLLRGDDNEIYRVFLFWNDGCLDAELACARVVSEATASNR
jgi:hypothetical protein